MQVRADQIKEGGVACGCGRSPTGFCIGWHGLSEEMYQHQKMLWMEDQLRKDQELAEYQQQAQEIWSDSCTTGRSK
jgi:hypothetical protein